MSKPFSRAIAMFALIRAAIGSVDPTAALAGIGSYTSRGHGKNKPFIRSLFSLGGTRSRYVPHQGKQECARRVRQMAGV